MDDSKHWKEHILDFLLETSGFSANSDVDEFRKRTVFALLKYLDADDVFLIKKIDKNAESIIVSSDKGQEGAFVDTSFLARVYGQSFVFHEEVIAPKRFHFLTKYSSLVCIPLLETHFEGVILLAWKTAYCLVEEQRYFLNIAIDRIKEVMRLNYAYISIDELTVKFNAVFHSVSQALVFVDDEGNGVWINPKAKQLLRIPEDKQPTLLLISECMTSLRERAENAEEILGIANELFENPNKEINNWIWKFQDQIFRVTSTPTTSHLKRGRLWVFEDITELYQINQQLIWYNQELQDGNDEIQKALHKVSEQNDQIAAQNVEIVAKHEKLEIINEEKNRLIGIVSHDLRAPLLQIKGFVQIIDMDRDTLNRDQKFSIDKVKIITERGLNLIKDLLDVSAIEQQITVKNIELIDAEAMLIEQVDAFRMSAESKQIRIHFANKANNCAILVDKEFFHRIMENLISNAIKFSHQNTSVEIIVENKGNEKLNILVKDEGQGIPEEDKPHLFGKFKKLSAKPTAGETSSGLGLSIVKALVEELNGKIHVESEWQKGTTFILEFDVVKQ